MSTDPYAPPPEPHYGEPAGVDPSYGGPPPFAPVPDPSEAASKKLAAGITGILLGYLGVHKFILGYNNAGIIMLVVTLATVFGGVASCGMLAPITLPVTGVMGAIGLAEGIIYLTKSDGEFYHTYMVGKKEWF